MKSEQLDDEKRVLKAQLGYIWEFRKSCTPCAWRWLCLTPALQPTKFNFFDLFTMRNEEIEDVSLDLQTNTNTTHNPCQSSLAPDPALWKYLVQDSIIRKIRAAGHQDHLT